MTMPVQCPKCRAPFPESLERFGANYACSKCGQIQRFEGEPPEIEDSLPERVIPAEDDELEEVIVAERLPPIDELLSDGWKIFRSRITFCLGTFVLLFLLNFAAQSPVNYLQEQLTQGKVPADQVIQYSIGLAIAMVLQTAFSTWLNIGYSRMMLKLVRSEPVELADLFRGGRYFWRGLICTILVSFAIIAGMFLCIVPGVIVSLIYWPFIYVLIDHDLPGVESLWKAAQVTDGKKANLFVLFMICLLIAAFGLLAMFVGVLIALPYTFVVTALAYDRISGVPRKHLPPTRPEE